MCVVSYLNYYNYYNIYFIFLIDFTVADRARVEWDRDHHRSCADGPIKHGG